MRKKGSGGHNKKRVRWGDMEFESVAAFAKYQGLKTRGAFHYYRKWKKLYRGNEIKVEPF